jgi:mRNA-degrading endonuclease toxin of MazEF toxin-antitoxin module
MLPNAHTSPVNTQVLINLATAQQRPAVVVSGTAYAQARPDVVLMAITSQVLTLIVG